MAFEVRQRDLLAGDIGQRERGRILAAQFGAFRVRRSSVVAGRLCRNQRDMIALGELPPMAQVMHASPEKHGDQRNHRYKYTQSTSHRFRFPFS
jgi:hypothetical protein